MPGMRARALHLRVEPIDAPPSRAGTYLVVWPREDGNGEYAHNAHPDRSIATAIAGDVIVHRAGKYRLLGVQRLGDWNGTWNSAAVECLDP